MAFSRLQKIVGITVLLAFVLTLGGCAKGTAGAGSGASGAYPNKPVSLIIAFTAGGSSDVQARIVEKYWKKQFNQPLAFEYKVGAGGQVGFTEIARARPDGYTIGGINAPHFILQSLSPQATFKKDDFIHIAQVVNDPQMLIVNKESRIEDVKGFIAEAKKREGKMTVGIVGTFTGHHMALLKMQDVLGITVTPVPFQGSADQNVALLGGHVDAIIGNLNDMMRSLDKLRPLGIAAEKRHDMVKEVPTFKELGFHFVSDIRRGFSVPAGTDPAIVRTLREGFRNICKDPEYLKDMERIGQPAEYMSGEEFTAYCDQYYEEAKGLIEEYGLNRSK
ncbi:tripartite tricarboxylate transporter substrate binding protein [Heliobacterium undosum]|uniref:Tripartite tricarboxylate transporter substrate binding protein n=1 Tax=Heliomicrobium undosum TaxID=121734 RepID=A0A845L5U3_9FIRM|nr:tripartite tricarboxylate transporter substrate binding protein [Heliomicrobium undosum]MZP30599.1 tripartite tricarboxylate transporter substrate binding protein [Heliomicrobium undosum]